MCVIRAVDEVLALFLESRRCCSFSRSCIISVGRYGFSVVAMERLWLMTLCKFGRDSMPRRKTREVMISHVRSPAAKAHLMRSFMVAAVCGRGLSRKKDIFSASVSSWSCLTSPSFSCLALRLSQQSLAVTAFFTNSRSQGSMYCKRNP